MDLEDLKKKVAANLASKGQKTPEEIQAEAEAADLLIPRCVNCGARWGEDYGDCISCTPEEVKIAKDNLLDSQVDANKLFDSLVLQQREIFIREQMKEALDTYHELYNKHKPSKYNALK